MMVIALDAQAKLIFTRGDFCACFAAQRDCAPYKSN
jgi:hypothetical protein